MATDIRVKRVLNRLAPADRISEEDLVNLPAGVELRAVLTQPRNPRHHAKYWALVSAIFPHQSAYPTLGDLHSALKMGVGFFRMVRDIRSGREVPVPDSIAFDKLDQQDFEAVYERIVSLVLEKILPGVGRRDLDAQVLDILAGRKVA